MLDKITIRGARVHNLKNINVDIPRNKLVVITGLSGSGKSSLAFDTIYAEGQRRYVESLSSYARQFLGVMDKPDVDQIEGLSPAISIDQKSVSKNPRSTVGTVTEIYDYLRLLFARVGKPHCPKCGKLINAQNSSQIIEQILALPDQAKIIILAPLIKDQKGIHKTVIEEVRQQGYARVKIDKEIYNTAEALNLNLERYKRHTIEVVIDRLILDKKSPDRARIADSVETALRLGGGVMNVEVMNEPLSESHPTLKTKEKRENKVISFSQHFACKDCGISVPELEPRNFSFNSPHGACSACTGLGTKLEIDPDLVIPNKNLSIYEGAIRPWAQSSRFGKRAMGQSWQMRILEAVARAYKINLNLPIQKLPKEKLDIVLYGASSLVTVEGGENWRIKEFETDYEGVIPNLERRFHETDSDYVRSEIEKYMIVKPCPVCDGKRLKPEVLAVKIDNYSIDQVVGFSIKEAANVFKNIKLGEQELKIAKQILKEINNRLQFLLDVGLDYLTIDRSSTSLSGGEAQRIRLATQIGSGLTGVLYILDEPSIGLHQRDNKKLINTLNKLRDIGNSVIVVEHDEETILSSDWVIDIGPGAGEYGGRVVAQGTPNQIKKSDTLTGQYLSGKKTIKSPVKFRNGNEKNITVRGASEHNLKNIDVEIPLGKFVCITGVSGSGKSTLINDILAKSIAQKFYGARDFPGKHKEITGLDDIDKVVNIDQSPIGRTPRSNPATYTGAFTYIRDLFASTQEARSRGYNAGRFSFNVKGGRCEACQGDGVKKIEMHFLPDVYMECEECHGKRYNKEALEIEYKGINIAHVLEMDIDTALKFFTNIPGLKEKLLTLSDVGLGFMKLGQPATTLSGGEAQRVKLATELSRRATGKTLYILDEPTTGLHFDDVNRLLNILNRLADKGNTVLVIEHNLEVIKCADWIIDLGPEGGNKGGEVVAEGTPKDVSKVKKSYTGQYLSKLF